jgi:transcriptional regulator with XRE-family HTH domain
VAERAHVSAALVSLLERGHIGSVSVNALRRIGAVIDVRIDIVPRWRAGELDRLLNARHSALGEAVAGWLSHLGGWIIAPEVSFAVDGERGWIDLLAWHAETRTLLVISFFSNSTAGSGKGPFASRQRVRLSRAATR